MTVKKLLNAYLVFLVLTGAVSCKKYLSLSPDSTLHTIQTIDDLQKLMDNATLLNSSYPSLSELVSDEIYVNAADWQVADSMYKKCYLWLKDDNTQFTWLQAYSVILNTNIVLDGLKDIKSSEAEQDKRNNVEGSALFIRAFYFYGLAQLFATPYNNGTAASDLGIPLRLNSDINEKSRRASVKETYERILADLKKASSLLPVQAAGKTRPGKGAAFGALARIYLSMSQYDSALVYADKYLAIHNELADYNVLLSSASPLADRVSKEVVFQMKSAAVFRQRDKSKIDSNLYRSFSNNDLRKTIHFKAPPTGVAGATFNGEYDVNTQTISANVSFSSISTDEIYFIKSEVLARRNNLSDAMSNLNKILESRYRNGFFEPLTASDSGEALSTILMEKRKELIRRGQRWTDIRRLTAESPAYAFSISRNLNGQSYALPQKQYLFLLPASVIMLGDVPQNE